MGARRGLSDSLPNSAGTLRHLKAHKWPWEATQTHMEAPQAPWSTEKTLLVLLHAFGITKGPSESSLVCSRAPQRPPCTPACTLGCPRVPTVLKCMLHGGPEASPGALGASQGTLVSYQVSKGTCRAQRTAGPPQFAPKAFAVRPTGRAFPGAEGLKLHEHWFYPSQNAKQCKSTVKNLLGQRCSFTYLLER